MEEETVKNEKRISIFLDNLKFLFRCCTAINRDQNLIVEVK